MGSAYRFLLEVTVTADSPERARELLDAATARVGQEDEGCVVQVYAHSLREVAGPVEATA